MTEFRCANDIFRYCNSPDHTTKCQNFDLKAAGRVTLLPVDVPCNLSPDTCTFSKRHSEIIKEDSRLGKDFRSLLFPDIPGQDDKKDKKPKKKVKEEAAQGNMFQ